MFKRIPFEWVEPGVDPTEQHHPLPRTRGNLKDALPWIVGLILVAAIGYQKFIGPRLETGAEANQKAAPAATATPARPALLSNGLRPAATLTATATATLTPTATTLPTATPTPTIAPPPTPTPLPAHILTFGVFEDGEQIPCWCNLDTGEVGGDDPEKCRLHPPSLCTP